MSPRYLQDIPKIYTSKYTPDIPKISPRYPIKYPPAQLVLKWLAHCSLWTRLGAEWRQLLLVEHQREELVWCWGVLREWGRPFGLYHLRCHQQLCQGGNIWASLDRRQRHTSGGCMAVDRQHALGIHILEWRRTKQQRRQWRLFALLCWIKLERCPL